MVALAVVLVTLKYWDYVMVPWARDGQVRAYVIQVAPRVSGPIVQLPIADNQAVAAGNLLFEIDPRTFQAVVDQANSAIERAQALLQAGSALVQARADLETGNRPARCV